MQHLDSLTPLSLPDSLVTIGVFDGVHLGHQSILQDMVRTSASLGVPSVLVTFFPHPSIILGKQSGPYYLTNPEERARLIAEQGIDYVVTLPFDEALARITADEFLEKLQPHLHFHAMWAGVNFGFGRNREGTVAYLEAASQQLGFDFHVTPPVYVDGRMVSSSRIREAIRNGRVKAASECLGRPYCVSGEVVHGAERGRSLGFPTANLEFWEYKLLPQNGVYACWAEVNGDRHQAVVNIGQRPTFESGNASVHLEAHLLDLRRDLYGEQLTLLFVDKIRDEKRFESVDDLKLQIASDIQTARSVLDPALPRGLQP